MIRKFKPEDIDRVMMIWQESNLDAHGFVEPSYWTSSAADVQEQLLLAEVYVFEKNSQLAGFAGMQGNYLAGLFVDTDMRSLGIGAQLLDYIKDRQERFSLRVFKENKGAVDFYLREGLIIVSEEVNEETNHAEYVMMWEAVSAPTYPPPPVPTP